MNAPVPALCACGSGLRPERCCALQLAAIPPAEATRHLVPLVERAYQALRQGARDTAEQLCLDVYHCRSGHPAWHRRTHKCFGIVDEPRR